MAQTEAQSGMAPMTKLVVGFGAIFGLMALAHYLSPKESR